MDRFAIPGLFVVSVGLVITLLIVSLTYKNVPSISSGATPEEISDYAYNLVSSNPGNGEVYDEATTYFQNQIDKATDEQAYLDLLLDYATFFGDTGNPTAGLEILAEIEAEELPPDARYYLYATYMYLYEKTGDIGLINDYRELIVEEGLIPYLASLDGVEIEGTCEVELLSEDEPEEEEEPEEDEAEDDEEEDEDEEETEE